MSIQGQSKRRPGQVRSAKAVAWSPCLESGEQKKDQGPRPQAWATRGQDSGEDLGKSQGAHVLCEGGHLGQELLTRLMLILASR